jgi:hypothetical protein
VPLFAETLTTQNRTILCGAKWHSGLFPALRANGWSLDACVSLPGRSADICEAFRFTWFATFGFVTKLLVVKEKLFASGEDKISSAIHAL